MNKDYEQITMETVMDSPTEADIAQITALKCASKGRGIEEVEAELVPLLTASRKQWVREYNLLSEVRDNKLFAPAFRSFNQWVSSLAEKTHVHQSTIWQHLKAGETYSKYVARATKKGTDVTPVKDLPIAAESLVLIDKIAGSSDEVADELIGKVSVGELSRQDLKAAYTTVKAQREDRGEKVAATSRHDKAPEKMSSDDITAVQLVLALSDKKHAWMDPLVPEKRGHVVNAYVALPEFPVRPGTTSHARRIDVLVAESLTCSQVGQIRLHGIEIKVDRSDLRNDTKFGEYADFIDFLWLCVPSDLVPDAQDVALDTWGILEYTATGALTIVKPPVKLPAELREEALVDLALKIIKS